MGLTGCPRMGTTHLYPGALRLPGLLQEQTAYLP